MMRPACCLSFVLLLGAMGDARADAPCASTLAELKTLSADPEFPLRWEETSMRDAKPLVVSIREKEGRLFMEFIKTREGLWAESLAVVCKAGTHLEARFTRKEMKTGPAASWLLRLALNADGQFKLTRRSSNQMDISTAGWSGTFAATRDLAATP